MEQQNNWQQQINDEEEQGIKWRDFSIVLLTHWYWIVLSIIVALVCAVLFIMHTTPTYTRSSLLLIKSDEKTNSASNNLPKEFQSLGLMGSNVNINNEIQTICAPVLVEEAVKRLHLNLEMSVERRLHHVPLYDQAPIQLLIPQMKDEDACFFKMRLNKDQTAVLYDFRWGKDMKDDRRVKVNFSTMARTPIGVVVIQSTPYWNKNFTDEEITVSKYPLSAVAGSYCSRLNVELNDKKSTILNITVSNASRQRADDFIYKLIDVYNEQWLKDRNRIAESTYEFISNRLNTLAGELGDVDQKISDYKSSTLMPDVDAASNLYMSQSAKNNDQILMLNNQLSVARYIRQYLASNNNEGQYLPANTGIGSTGIENMIAEYNKGVSKRNELLQNTSESSQFVQQADADLKLQKTAIIRSLDNLIAQIETQVKSWQGNEAQTNQKLASAPHQVKQLLSVGRQQKVKETLYIYLLQKREENELSKTYTAWNTRIIQPPVGSEFPSSPRKKVILLVALAIGICIPVGIYYLRETLNNKVRGRSDLEGMNTPLLGEIPILIPKKKWWQRQKKATDTQIVVKENSRDLINEAFRVLRTKVDYYLGSINKETKIIMVTSFNIGSGKTFISSNLGKVLSLRQQRVLIIDMDLRKSSLSKIISRPHHGISDYLSGVNDNYEELICRDAFGENADVMPVGVVPPNPSELLLSEKLGTMLEELRKKYDYIILDCPPIDTVADTSIVKQYCDMTLFIIRVGLMNRTLLKDVDELYSSKNYNHMTLLLNGVNYVSSRYGSYRYGYGYGYGYGYAESLYEDAE